MDRAAAEGKFESAIPHSIYVSLVFRHCKETFQCDKPLADGADKELQVMKLLDLMWPIAMNDPDSGLAPVQKASLGAPKNSTIPAKGLEDRVRLAHRILSDKMVTFIKGGLVNEPHLLFLCDKVCVVAAAEQQSQQQLSQDDTVIMEKFRRECICVTNAIKCINGKMSPGTIQADVVKQLASYAKASSNTSAAVVQSALMTSQHWKDGSSLQLFRVNIATIKAKFRAHKVALSF